MKLLSKTLLCILLTLTSVVCFAQTPGQKLFAAYPQTVSLDKSLLNNAFSYTKGSNVTVALSQDFLFKGTVISNEKREGNLQTVMIRSNENRTVFQITKYINTENNIVYAGRILNSNYADGYELKNNNGTYNLQKFETARILEPCKL